tara:strand:+ start:1047 stop:1310 length:264 start_codon:yes stop_codon:yes gene_type:complete
MNAQHAPGPWKHSLSTGRSIAIISDAEGFTIFEMLTRTKDSRFPANVRLACAAPAMLEALQRIAVITSDPEVQAIADAAISRAMPPA